MALKWFEKSYRRNLVDMHIDDWNPEFLSEFDPKKYLEYLKAAKMDSMMLYLQSHAGLCYYPTKSGVMHKAFEGRERMMNELIDLCHENDIFVVGYYSLVFNSREEKRHPEWGLIDDAETYTSPYTRGKSRYGHCCPNNPEYRAFLREQITEMAELFPTLDGMFYDMTFWPYLCKCRHCKARLKKDLGLDEFPEMGDNKSENGVRLRKIRQDWLAEFAEYVSGLTEELMPGVSISHNNASAVGNAQFGSSWGRAVDERIGDACTYLTGDLYGSILEHSFSQKYYRVASKAQPFEYMVTRFSQNLTQHTLTKTVRQLTQCTLLTAAHHGANFVIDAIDPVGTLNLEVAEIIGAAYAAQLPYEKHLKMGAPVADVGVWYSITGRYNSEAQNFNSLSASAKLGETLGANHVLYDLVANRRLSDLKKYPFVFAPAIAGLEKEHIDAAIEYVKEGGVLCFSGTEEPALLKEFFGAELVEYTSNVNSYVAPTEAGAALFAPFTEKYPLSLSHKHPLVTGVAEDATVLATLKTPYSDPNDPTAFASIHSNPPGILTNYPSVIEKDYGKGKAVWLATPIEFYTDRQHRELMMKLLRRYYPACLQTVTSTASHLVELLAFKDEGEWQISAINVGDAEDGRLIPNFTVTVKTGFAPKGVYLLPDEKTSLPFTYEDGKLTFTVENMDLFAMYKII